jgi:hypothetical protein
MLAAIIIIIAVIIISAAIFWPARWERCRFK